MSKTWKDQPRNVRNVIAKDLGTPKYRRRIVPDKSKDAKAKMLDEWLDTHEPSHIDWDYVQLLKASNEED